MLHSFDACDTFLQVLQLGGKGLWRQPGISTPFCQLISCSVCFVYTGNLVYSARKLSTRAFLSSLFSCMWLAILRGTKKSPPKAAPLGVLCLRVGAFTFDFIQWVSLHVGFIMSSVSLKPCRRCSESTGIVASSSRMPPRCRYWSITGSAAC